MNSSHHQQPSIPPPNGQVLSLISALSNTSNHALHVQAIRARDAALSASLDSYQQLCYQLVLTLIGTDQSHIILSQLSPRDVDLWQQTDPQSVLRLQQDPTLWIPFGQMAGLILKDALLRPPSVPYNPQQPQRSSFSLQEPVASQMQDCLLQALSCHHAEQRAVASSIVATLAVSPIGILSGCVQPLLHLKHWKNLIPTLIRNVQSNLSQSSESNAALLDGSLTTIRKIMEDGPQYLDQEELDSIVPILLQVFHLPISSQTSSYQLAALQSLAACLSHHLMPSALILHLDAYWQGLSQLGHSPQSSYDIQQWVCRNIVTLLSLKSEFVQPHFESICQFILSKTAEGTTIATTNQPTTLDASTDTSSQQQQQRRLVALEACEFWLTLANLDDVACTSDMTDIMIQHILPSLIPTLVQCMVYSLEQQQDLIWQNQHDLEQSQHNAVTMKPIFHRSKAMRSSSTATSGKVQGGGGGGGANQQSPDHPTEGNQEEDDNDSTGDDDADNDDDEDDEEGNEWTLRKCAAASLDSLAGVFGAEPILPHLLPALQQGLQSPNMWVQEASILALGAVAEGCSTELSSSLSQLCPHLLNILALPEDLQSTLPQLKCICAWTIGRYAPWAVEEVQSGRQGQLLGQLTQVFMTRLGDCNRRVQVACCSAFGVVIEFAGDLMVPYLEPVYHTLVTSMNWYQGRSLLMIFDVLGIMADCCGPAIAEGELPFLYVPPLLQMWGSLAKNDPSDRTLLPLMESLASIAVTSGMNFQPFALETYENAMAIIESGKLMIVTMAPTAPSADQTVADDANHVNDEDADPITCATDLLDGLVEGLGASFTSLVSSSQRYGPSVFLTMLHSLLCQHDFVTPGVHMSALALLGDLARHAPTFLQPALPQLLQEAIQAFDPSMYDASVCTNAVWAVGEICLKCRPPPDQGKQFSPAASVLAPFVPTLMQNLIALLTGNGAGMGNRCVDIPGLAENAAACAGRLALVNPDFVAPDLPRFILGWCEGLSKITDPDERRDGFSGFLAAVYANPSAIQTAVGAQDSNEVFVSILFAIMTWHIPESNGDASAADEVYHTEILHGPKYTFRAFPQQESELGTGLVRLVHDMKASVGEESWRFVEKGLPVNVRQLLRQAYNV